MMQWPHSADRVEVGSRIIVDSQIHLWPPKSKDRPWSEGRGQLYPSFSLGRYLDLAQGSGVHRALIIPPAVDATRIDYAKTALAHFPERFRIVAFVEPHLPEQEILFQDWKNDKDILAIRSSILDGRQDILHNGSTDWLWAAAERYHLPLMFAQTSQLETIETIVERHPDLILILDHFGLSEATIRKGLAASTINAAVSLAKYPNVSVKLSSSAALSTQAYPWHDLDDYIYRLVEAYGPQRCYWGSDITASLSKSDATYRQRVTHFTDELGFLSEEDKDWIMGRALMERLGWD
ncbi:amidohydrolase family protein [Novosphingobium mathurense]|uniref:Predicted metal-dependent hydrolase, TIM-barrel fold n=1 Tax=Novosphingobium mathurense TaxID=428990 RepID=A0A1U6IXT5_9SPHN|nr:amidohydrolase family protein [Novosphingobium mathurense]SLK12811.1 Predicted metal-dependent hydrolase, TIM-barrel fold [Novosphingobium mathurense]